MAVAFGWGLLAGLGLFLTGLVRMLIATAGGRACTVQILELQETDYPYNGDTGKTKFVYSVDVTCKGEKCRTRYEAVVESGDPEPLEPGTVLKMRYNGKADKLYDVKNFRSQMLAGAVVAVISTVLLLVVVAVLNG